MQNRQYGDYQFDIYLNGLQGKLPRCPVDYGSLERAGVEVLPSWVGPLCLLRCALSLVAALSVASLRRAIMSLRE